MKLSIKLAGLFGSGVFICTALPGFYQQIKPASVESMIYDMVPGMEILETLGVSLLGALVAGGIGYKIGDILSNPAGNYQKQRGRAQKQPKQHELRPVTGEETYLDDLESAPLSPGTEDTLSIEPSLLEEP
ncbi:MAG TPA: hypothetical protein V6C52_04975 [Coleofasciculaceae cyanobacterium]|jgi:hypothetical protein